jgi:hypothetical protein
MMIASVGDSLNILGKLVHSLFGSIPGCHIGMITTVLRLQSEQGQEDRR